MYAFINIVGKNWIADIWKNLIQTTNTGKGYYDNTYGINFFDWLKNNEEAQKEFDVGMTSISSMSDAPVVGAYNFSRFNTLVDIGGGHGSQLVAILKTYPGVKKGIIFDQPSTVESLDIVGIVKKENIEGRLETVGGDFFNSVPSGFDGYFMKSILHDWDDEKAVKILSNCRNAMRKDSMLIITENIIKDEDNTPDFGKVLDINVLILMGGRVRTKQEYSKILRDAGLELKRIIPTLSPFVILEVAPI
jgi:hypothetical protein